MTAKDFLAELSGRGVLLKATPEGNLRCKGKLATSDIIRLKEHKQELLRLILNFPQSSRKTPSPASPTSPVDKNSCKLAYFTEDGTGDDPESNAVPQQNAVPRPPRFLARKLEQAAELGLVARWSQEFGYIAIHDPTIGSWHEVATGDAPSWAKREAHKRKELRKRKGITRLLTSAEMEEIFTGETPAMWEHPAITDKGIVYEDYLDEKG
jgi:hypothetical protein